MRVAANPQAFLMFGLSTPEWLRQNLESLIVAADAATLASAASSSGFRR
jgi:hypothetical protein